MKKRLYRSTKDKVIGGVCGGLAQYFDIDPTIVRLIFIIGFFAGGIAFVGYIAALIIMPLEPENYSSYQDSYYETTGEPSGNNENARLFLGGTLIAIGVIFIAKRYFYWFDFEYIWPVILIVVGGLLLFKGRE